MNKKEKILNSRSENFSKEELIGELENFNNNKNDQDEKLSKYNKLKNDLKFNLKDDINNKIQRMKILYEIKEDELYRYDGFNSFEQFIKSFVIAKSQAYKYLKIYEKVLEGVVSIDKIKEVGFKGVYDHIQKKIDINKKSLKKEDYNENIPIRILVKDKEVYEFCKKDTKRLYFIIERLFKNKKDILSDLMIEYENYRKEKYKIR